MSKKNEDEERENPEEIENEKPESRRDITIDEILRLAFIFGGRIPTSGEFLLEDYATLIARYPDTVRRWVIEQKVPVRRRCGRIFIAADEFLGGAPPALLDKPKPR